MLDICSDYTKQEQVIGNISEDNNTISEPFQKL